MMWRGMMIILRQSAIFRPVCTSEVDRSVKLTEVIVAVTVRCVNHRSGVGVGCLRALM